MTKAKEQKEPAATKADDITNPPANIYQSNGIVLFKSYDELIKSAGDRLRQESQAFVFMRWTLGAHVKAMLEAAAYGDHKIDDLVNDLSLSKQTLYACKALFETYSREEMNKRIIPLNIPFRALNYLVRIDDAKARDSMLTKVAKGEVKPEEIPTLIEGAKPPEAGQEAGEGGKGAATAAGKGKSPDQQAAGAVRKAAGAVDAALDVLEPALVPLVEALDRMGDIADGDLYDEVAGELENLQDRLKAVGASVEKTDKALAKVAKA